MSALGAERKCWPGLLPAIRCIPENICSLRIGSPRSSLRDCDPAKQRNYLGLAAAAGLFQHATHLSADRVERNATSERNILDGFSASQSAGDAGFSGGQIALYRALIYSRCNLWGKGEPNLLKLLGVQTFSVASSMTLYSAAPPDRILTRSPQVTGVSWP